MYGFCLLALLSIGLSGCNSLKNWILPGKTYVVIGSSAAGISATQELMRHVLPQDTVILISKDPDDPYDRTKLKSYMVSSTIPHVAMSVENDQKMPLIYKTTVEHIDPAQKIILCADGSSIAYDYLFLGIGTEPCIPVIEGMHECTGIYGYYTLQDARAIKEYLVGHSVKTIVVIGGSLAALEITAALSGQGYSVHQCVRGPRILREQADEGGACRIQQLFADHDVQWHFNTQVTRVQCADDGTLTHVVLNDTTELPADMVIYAIGGTVSRSLVGDCIDMQCDGISVDEYMRTSDPYMYAGGDAVCMWDYVNERFVRNQKWHAAEKQGICAARNMCKGYQSKQYYGSAIVHGARYFNTIVAFSGPMGNPPADYTYTVDTENGYRAFLTKDDQLKGFCLVGVSKEELKKYSAILKNDN